MISMDFSIINAINSNVACPSLHTTKFASNANYNCIVESDGDQISQW